MREDIIPHTSTVSRVVDGKMKKCAVFFALLAFVKCNPVEQNGPAESFIAAIRECVDGEAVLCLKEKALKYTEKIGSPKKMDIVDGLTILTTGSPRSARSYEPLAEDPKARELQLDERIAENVGDLLDNTVVQFRLSDTSDQDESRALEEEGRGKKKKKIKKLLPLILLLKMKLFALIPLFLGIIAFVAFKALLLGKIAFLASSVSLIRRLISKGGGGGGGHSSGGSSSWSSAPSYNYNAQPSHEEHGWDSSNGWGRSKTVDAQSIAYSGHVRK